MAANSESGAIKSAADMQSDLEEVAKKVAMEVRCFSLLSNEHRHAGLPSYNWLEHHQTTQTCAEPAS
jgi:hypothetical protein